METNEKDQLRSGSVSPGMACSPSSTPETDAWLAKISERRAEWTTCEQWARASQLMTHHARQLERERDAALTALLEIEEIFVDGSDTYEDWKSMGTIAREFLSENVQGDGRREPAPPRQ